MDEERTPTEGELVARARGGCAAAYCALVERHERSLYRFVRLRARCAADAEEIVQDAFVRAWTRLDAYEERWRFATWLFTIAHRIAISRARARGQPAGRIVDEPVSGQHDPAARLDAREARENLWALARRVLAPDQCTALWLRYVEELSPAEIARVLGKTPVGVRVGLLRARRRLRHALAPHEDDLAVALARARPLPGATP